MADIIQFRRDTLERWSEFNPTLAEGEIGFVLDSPNQYKMGDGVHAWNDLPIRGFNGNIVNLFTDNEEQGYDSVMSLNGLSKIFKYIVSNGSHIDVGDDWTILDELNNIDKCGFYILMKDKSPCYHMMITGDNGVYQWIFGDLLIEEDGQIRGNRYDGAANIVFRKYSQNTWSDWKYLQDNFISDGETTQIFNDKSCVPSLSYFKKVVNEIQTKLQSKLSTLESNINNNKQEIDALITNILKKQEDLTTQINESETAVNNSLQKTNEAISLVNKISSKVEKITTLNGIIDYSNDGVGISGIYLIRNSGGKLYEIREYTDDSYTVLSPSVGNIYTYNGIYYGWNGKIFAPIGGGSGTGSGTGNYNITTQIPLNDGNFYTLETALSALRREDIDNDLKKGFVITFEESAGNWLEYRFVGTNVSDFYDKTKWEEYGGKGAIKKIRVLQEGSELTLTPDENGSVNLDIPKVNVDETLDESSTNPVQNKAVAAEFKSVGNKFGAAIKLNTIGEGSDKSYSLSLLTENGEILNTTEEFSGGSGSTTATKIVLTRITPNLTVKNGDEVKLSYQYDHVNTSGVSTGNVAKITITIVRGANSSSFETTAQAGSTQTIDVTKYMGVGTNTIRVRAEVGEDEAKQVSNISWTINVVQLTLTSSFSIATLINSGDIFSVPYNLTGSGNKTLRCYLDGVDIEDKTITTSTANGSFSINTSGITHGEHSIQLVAELELTDGSVIKSNSIYFDVAVRVAGNSTPIITTRFDYADGTIIRNNERPYISLKQYESLVLNYSAYNPKETPTKVEIYEDEILVTTTEIAFVPNKFDLRVMNYGTETCKIVCGSHIYTFNLEISKSDLNIVEPTDGLKLKLLAQGRTNDDTNRDEWLYKDISVEFSNFNWGGDGWINNALRHTNEAKSVVKYKPLEQPTNPDNAFTFIIKYKITEVVDENVEIIKCLDEDGVGFVITPTEARINTRGNSQIAMKMASDNEYEVGFVSFPKKSDGSSDYEKKNTEMIYLYINGVMSGSVQRGTSDVIYQSTASYIQMGAVGATLDVYLLRGYNTFLTDDQMLSCFIFDQSIADNLVNKYLSNDILDDNGNISIESIPDGMRVIIVTGKQANGTPTVLQAAITNNKKTKYDVEQILSYVKNGNAQQNFLCIGGCIRLQGTSSLAYPIKNYRIYFKNVAKEEGKLYLGCNEQGVGGSLQEKAKFSFRLASSNNYAAAPVDCFCTKADFAESSSSHNTGMARIVHDTLLGIGELVPPQKYVDRKTYNYDVRTTIDGEPCLFFYRGSLDETPQFLGKYNFNNDKSTEDVFGFLNIPGYHDQEWVQNKFGGDNPTECWEFLNNDYPMGMFLDDDFDSKGADGVPNWMKVFEARFPDDDNINAQYEAGTKKPIYLERLVKWVKSTDTTAEGLSETQKQQRADKFRKELQDYFDINYLCDYYEFTDIFACVDQRVKNMMLAFWYSPDVDKMLAYMIFYDNDTILGVRNDGRLRYNWDVDENTIDKELSTPDKTVYAFAGHDSVLWKNLREQFPNELKAAYVRLRSKLTNDKIFQVFDTEQSEKFCERIYNLDAINKYIVPKTEGIETNDGNVKYSYLEAMQGNRTAHRHWFVSNRMGLFDAWGSTGQYTATDISFKGNSSAGATVRAISARDFYFEFRREGETMTHDRVSKDQVWSYTYDQVANIGTIFHLFGGMWMHTLDLSDWGGFTDINIPLLPILKKLILGNSTKTYNLTELAIGTKLPMLEQIDIENYVNLPSLDLSGCTRILKVNASGCTAMTTIRLAQGVPIEYLHLPQNYQTLTLRSLPNLTRENIEFDNIDSVIGMWVENCALLNGFELFKELFKHNLRYVRLTGLNIEGDGSDLQEWYDADLGGIDIYGNLVNGKCKIGGYYRLTSYLDDEIYDRLVERFDELNIIQPQYTMIGFDCDEADDAIFTNFDNKTGYIYGNTYQPSAHITKILNQRFGCLGKVTEEGTMKVCKLHNDNFNFYADNEVTALATSANLKGPDGDVFIYEPKYYYKGINDLLGVFSKGVPRKYSCFSSRDEEPDRPDVVVLTLDDIKALGNYQANYYVKTGSTTLADSLIYSTSAGFAVCTVDVSKHKYVRFPSVKGTNFEGAVICDAEGNVLKNICIYSESNAKLQYGMYVISDVPEGGHFLTFSIIQNNLNFSGVVLSNSDRVEDMEPDWVCHEPCLVAAFMAVVLDGKVRSICINSACITGGGNSYNSLTTLAENRKMQMTDYEMYKDIANLFFAKYGKRNSQLQCGNGSDNVTRVGPSAFLGLKDTINNNGTTSYINSAGQTVGIEQVKCLGYEDLYCYKGEIIKGIIRYATSTTRFHITRTDGNEVPFYAFTSGGYIKHIYHEKFMDILAACLGASSSTFYADQVNIYGSSEMVAMFGYYSSKPEAGVTGMQFYGPRTTNPGGTVSFRLSFRGNIIVVDDISEYLELVAIS